jgi:hypothetical protein
MTLCGQLTTLRYSAVLICTFLFVCTSAGAQECYNNYTKEYRLVSQTEGGIESFRTQRMILCDFQPSGLYVKRGEKVSFVVVGLTRGYNLSSMIGFKPMWGNRNKTQETALRNGVNTVTATQDGILSFIFVKARGTDITPTTVNVKVTGGKAFPLYELGRTNLPGWSNDLRIMTDAPFVQFVSDKALVTLPYRDYMRRPMADIATSFAVIHRMIDLQDELAGFDNTSVENMRTRNRLHYVVDVHATAKERENWYMYASDYMIGMKADNFMDLTNKLATEWGIWHETGHTHQQSSWTWDSIGEISVNMYSLYVQEKFGLPSRLTWKEGGETLTSFEKARRYIADPRKNYLVSNEDTDYNELFSKLVMFHQLKSVYGWDAIKKMHQYFRKQPYDADDSDEAKANRFIFAMCFVTKSNLLPFFRKWGLNADRATTQKVNDLRLPSPKRDPSTIFR